MWLRLPASPHALLPPAAVHRFPRLCRRRPIARQLAPACLLACSPSRQLKGAALSAAGWRHVVPKYTCDGYRPRPCAVGGGNTKERDHRAQRSLCPLATDLLHHQTQTARQHARRVPRCRPARCPEGHEYAMDMRTTSSHPAPANAEPAVLPEQPAKQSLLRLRGGIGPCCAIIDGCVRRVSASLLTSLTPNPALLLRPRGVLLLWRECTRRRLRRLR